jgi:1-acyl-sn-glycerol-3-phosphate acyltransferase
MFRTLITMIVIAVMTFLCGLTVILLWPFGSYNQFTNKTALIWAKSILWAAGTKVQVYGLDKIDFNKSFVFVGNHQSHIDVLAVFSILTLTVRFIAKKELFKIPLFGWAMTAAGIIKVDRSNREKAIKSIERAGETIQRGVSVILFPEGTRSSDGEIHQFKKGAFVLATKSNVPVVPISISGTRNILKKHSLKLNPGKVKIIISDPIDSSNYKLEDREIFASDVRQIIINNFDKNFNQEKK